MTEQLTEIYSYLHGMWRYRWTAILVTWLVALAGWFYVYNVPSEYSSNAVVYIDTSSIMKPLLKGLAPETDSYDEIKVMSRILLSRDNLLSVIRETDMDLKIDSPMERENLVEKLANTITLKGGGNRKRWEPKSNIYEISYQSNSAKLAHQVVSKLLGKMIEGTLNSTRTDTITAHKFLDRQITEYETRLSLAEQQLAKFKKTNVGYMPDEKGGYYKRLQHAQDAVESTRSLLRIAERRYLELTNQLKDENPMLGREVAESASNNKIRQYQEQVDLLLNKFTEQHPDILALRSIISDLKFNKDVNNNPVMDREEATKFNPVYQEIKVELSKAGVEIEILKSQLVDHRQRVVKLTGSIDIIPEVEAELSKLNRDYQVTRERYLDLVERRESAKLAQSAEQSSSNVTFRVIEPPIVPFQASGPNRLLLMTGVLFAAFIAGLGWSFVKYQLQPTYNNVKQVISGTGYPLLGYVSLYLTPEHKRKRKIQLISFVFFNMLLFCAYGGILFYGGYV